MFRGIFLFLFLFLLFSCRIMLIGCGCMRKPELLAPVGNMECLFAAVEAGCDAVYLGGYAFGARNYAVNFSREELKEAVRYAHLYGVKVYITVNTIVYEAEVDTFLDYVDYLVSISVDALILQDLGMFDLVHQMYPDLELHASTQMHLHNKQGVMFAKELGFSRAVVAREMDIDTISSVKRDVDIELEVFVHGALCISYSGQCLMSSLIGGRSGNRGTCAGSCRQKYDFIGDRGNGLEKLNCNDYVLSTRDLCTIDQIGSLIDIGVDSLKIEGRMKRPEYVYLVVSLYRKAIEQYINDGIIHITEEDIKELMNIFNRKFTKGFLFDSKDIMNEERPNHMGTVIGKVVGVKKGKIEILLTDKLCNGDGIRILDKEDVGMTITKIEKGNKIIKEAFSGDKVLISSTKNIRIGCKVVKTTDKEQLERIAYCLKKKNRKVKIQGKIRLKVGDNPVLSFKCKDVFVQVCGDNLIDRALKQPLSKDRVCEQINKLGNSVYEIERLDIEMDDDVFIPIFELNALRRLGIERLTSERLKRKSVEKRCYHREVKSFPVEKKKNVLIYSYPQYLEVKDLDYDRIYVEKEEVYQSIQDDSRVILKLPRVMHKFLERSGSLLVSEMGSLYQYSNVSTEFSFNVVNSYTVAFLHSLGVNCVTLSYEQTQEQIKDLIDAYRIRYSAHPNLELIVRAREEVMVTKFPFVDYYGSLGNENYLKDRFGNLYPVVKSSDFVTIYNYQVRKMLHEEEYYNLGVNQLRYHLDLDFKDR